MNMLGLAIQRKISHHVASAAAPGDDRPVELESSIVSKAGGSNADAPGEPISPASQAADLKVTYPTVEQAYQELQSSSPHGSPRAPAAATQQAAPVPAATGTALGGTPAAGASAAASDANPASPTWPFTPAAPGTVRVEPLNLGPRFNHLPGSRSRNTSRQFSDGTTDVGSRQDSINTASSYESPRMAQTRVTATRMGSFTDDSIVEGSQSGNSPERPETAPLTRLGAASRAPSMGSLTSDYASYTSEASGRKSLEARRDASALPMSQLQKALENLMLTDPELYTKLQGSLRGIGTPARETNQLQLGRDKTGATVINQYVVVKTLGRGAFGKVKLCLNTVDNQLYAIKMINRSHLLKSLQRPRGNLRRRASTSMAQGPTSDAAAAAAVAAAALGGRSSFAQGEQQRNPLEEVIREIAIMKKMDHPNVVKLYEVIDPPGAQHLMLVMEYMERGPVIATAGQNGFPCFPEEVSLDFFRQACRGLDYLHYNKVVHGDLKPENLLVSATGELKLADFGSSRVLDGKSIQQRLSGTPAFSAPEVINCSCEDAFAADVWALGACLYCFTFGRLPFQGSCMLDIYKAITSDEVAFPEGQPISGDLRDLLVGMFDKDPGTRISLAGVMQHPWVTDNGRQRLLVLGQLTAPPKQVEVTAKEAQGAIGSGSQVGIIRARLKEKMFRSMEYLFQKGQASTCVYFIMSGSVELLEPSAESTSVTTEEQSFTVDIDESLTLDANAGPLVAQDIINGRLHMDRQKVKDIKQRRKSWLMEVNDTNDVLLGIKGPGQVVGEVSLDESPALCPYSARARGDVLALKLTQENYIRALAGVLMDEGSRAQPNTQLNAALGAPRVRRSISEGAGQLGATQDGVYVTSY